MNRKVFSYVCFGARYTLMFIFFVILHLSSFSSSSVTPTMLIDLEYMIPIILIDVTEFLFLFLAYFSITRTFSITEPTFKAAVNENKEGLKNFTQKAAFVLTTPHIYFEFLITSFFFIVTSYSSLILVLHPIFPKDTSKVLVTFLIIVCSFALSLLARISAIKELCYKATFEEIKFGRADKKYGIWHLLKNCALLAFIYPIATIMIPYIFAILAVPFLFGKKDTIVIISVILCVVVLLFAVRYIKAFFRRRKFLRKFRKFCKKNKFRLENEVNMIRSVFKDHEGANFVIDAYGKRYACKLVASKNKMNPMYFTEKGELYEVKNKSFTFLTSAKGMGAAMLSSMSISKKATVSSFAFESQYPKIVIVNPIPTRIFAGHPDHSMQIDVGSKVGDYRIYNASGFINALERNCLDR